LSGQGDGYEAVNMAADGRVACSNCGRMFSADRIALHQRVCRPK